MSAAKGVHCSKTAHSSRGKPSTCNPQDCVHVHVVCISHHLEHGAFKNSWSLVPVDQLACQGLEVDRLQRHEHTSTSARGWREECCKNLTFFNVASAAECTGASEAALRTERHDKQQLSSAKRPNQPAITSEQKLAHHCRHLLAVIIAGLQARVVVEWVALRGILLATDAGGSRVAPDRVFARGHDRLCAHAAVRCACLLNAGCPHVCRWHGLVGNKIAVSGEGEGTRNTAQAVQRDTASSRRCEK